MCALDLGLPWSVHTRPVNHTRLRNVIMTGVAVRERGASVVVAAAAAARITVAVVRRILIDQETR